MNYEHFTDEQLRAFIKPVNCELTQSEVDEINEELYKRSILRKLEKGAVLGGLGFLAFADDERFERFARRHEKILKAAEEQVEREEQRLARKKELLDRNR